MEVKERIGFKTEWRIDKFKDPNNLITEALSKGISFEKVIALAEGKYLGTEVFEGNLGLNEGIAELIDIICGLGTPTKWDNTNARLGVGNSNAAADPSQNGLQGASKTFKAMDATYPQRSGQSAIWRATFGSGEGNHGWQEFTVVNAADDTGDNLNRKVEDKGTKSSGETWTLQLTVTFS